MSRQQDLLTELISSLKQQRDELALQIHLGKAEAKEEWEKVQARLDQLTADAEPLKEAVEESAENVLESLKLVADEIKNSFDRIRKSL
jgi:chromosome segregation ATPase